MSERDGDRTPMKGLTPFIFGKLHKTDIIIFEKMVAYGKTDHCLDIRSVHDEVLGSREVLGRVRDHIKDSSQWIGCTGNMMPRGSVMSEKRSREKAKFGPHVQLIRALFFA
ncbi:MAG: hypothetical protein GYA39_04780 [Methanothrix sp.]|nr:hypothetical protein [Methanothrix sp.]